MLSERARSRLDCPAGPIAISPSVIAGDGNTLTLIGPVT